MELREFLHSSPMLPIVKSSRRLATTSPMFNEFTPHRSPALL
ncbi:hypothetical protein ACPOL_6047 [Acidisarcina polymorpha]|uniref:Uncharacterized protein n=1 Tax=Acidisarcina polymorpha TaxID=2211140 RepID=A0A2Z5G898_9BACT|nr:hypothetical protein ACPOL_6047 [Acidisarcina polymorpha]